MNYSLADSLRFVRHLTTSDLDTDNVDLLHVIGEHLENLRNSGDESAKELLKELVSVPLENRDEKRINDVLKAISFNEQLLKEYYE